jgi:Kef-type K+ transport system membrane component KefB/CBS domain-containing protein
MEKLILLIGIAIILGSVGGRVFARLGIPQVVGYIVIGIVGIIVGGTLIHVVSPLDIRHLEPVSLIALSIIGFNIGGELRKDIFQKHGSKFLVVLVCEGITAALLVTFLTGLVSCPWSRIADLSLLEVLGRGNWPLAILLGAIASATAPAATVDVLWEYRTRGILTTTVLAIVALDDGLALLLYGFASSIADLFREGQGTSFVGTLAEPLYSIFGSLILGAIVGAAFGIAFRRLQNRDMVLPICVGGLFSIIGLCGYLHLDLILTSMSAGVALVNVEPTRSQDAFEQVSRFAPPIYVLFFVLVGARLQPKSMAGWMIILALAYVIGRTAGKFLGAYLGSRMAGMPEQVQKYLGWCLFSQAGVAIGLAIIASHDLEHQTAQAIILIITATTFLVQIIGPPSVKFAVKRAGEVGRDVREEDLLSSFIVGDVMDPNPPFLKPHAPLSEVLQVAAPSDSLYFPVLDHKSRLMGMISFLDIKRIFAMDDLGSLVLAYDLMVNRVPVTLPNVTLYEAMERMKQENLEVLAVVDSEEHKKLLGMLERRRIHSILRQEILRRRGDALLAH